jgi:hypothetical protein
LFSWIGQKLNVLLRLEELEFTRVWNSDVSGVDVTMIKKKETNLSNI